MRWLVAIASTALLIVLAAPLIHASKYGAGSYGSCQYGACSLSLSSSSSVSLPLTPSAAGACTVARDTVSVSTSSSTGYSLYVSSASIATAMQNGAGQQINATSGTRAAPAILSNNTWGYRLDGGNFGPGPTSAANNIPIPTTTFAGVSSIDNPALLVALTTYQAPPSETSVWYGACADTTLPSGTYTSTVTYTAIVN